MGEGMPRIRRAAAKWRRDRDRHLASSDELRQVMREELDAGTVSQSEIARELDVTRQRISQFLRGKGGVT